MGGATLSLLASAGGGAAPVTIRIDPATVLDFSGGGTASSQFLLSSDGSAYEAVGGGSPTVLYPWCVPAAQAANYEVYATLVSGALSGGSSAVSTWLALTSTRSWIVSTSGGIASATLNIGLRQVGTTSITAADVDLYAQSL